VGSIPDGVIRMFYEINPSGLTRGSVRSTRGLGPTMTARGQIIGISIGMLPQTLIMSITVQKTSKYYTTKFDFEEGF
jgi:hypothetical protein